MQWHLQQTGYSCSCSRRGSRNITKTVTWIHLTNLVFFFLTPAKLSSARPNTDCLAALNGVCTKRNTAQFELLLFKNKVNNNSQTWPLIHLTSLATFYSKILLLKWVMPVKEYHEYEDEYWWIWTKCIGVGSGGAMAPPILAIYSLRPAWALHYQYFRLFSILYANPPESLLALL